MTKVFTPEERNAMTEYHNAVKNSPKGTGQVTYPQVAGPFTGLPQQSEEEKEAEMDMLEEIREEFLEDNPLYLQEDEEVEVESMWRTLPSSIRALVKDYLTNKVQVIWHSVCPKGVTTVALRVVVDNRKYRAVGNAKWREPDEFSVEKGFNIAYDKALVELVDKVLGTERHIPSRIFVN